jgi:chromosome partitioning protein
MISLAVINQKGGVGKTTTAINLAAALAEAGKRIILADLDPQGNATGVLGLKTADLPGTYEVLIGERAVEEVIHATRFANLHAIPATLDLAGAEIEVARLEDHLGQLRRAFDPLRSSQVADFLLLDCPPSLGILMSNALVAADQLLIPIQCEYYALEGLNLLMQVAGNIAHGGINPDLKISGMVMTMFDARTNLNGAVVRDVREHFGEVVYETAIPRTVRFGEAPSHGMTILEYDGNGAGARAYRELAHEFLDRQSRQLSFLLPAPATA